MRQVAELDQVRQGLGDRRDWFRVGMASATIVTPLISRWRALRAAERARALWQASQQGARWPWVHTPASTAEVEVLPPLARREVRSELWLAGVVVGLAAAGTTAFIIARRRLRADEPPLDVPLIVHAGDAGSPSGLGAVPAALTTNAAGGGAARVSGSAGHTPATLAPANGLIPPATAPTAPEDTRRQEHPPTPGIVGNTETLLYMLADGDDLPPETVRVYFENEAQATQAGYRAAPGAAGPGDDAHE